jgi:hypothetical protein
MDELNTHEEQLQTERQSLKGRQLLAKHLQRPWNLKRLWFLLLIPVGMFLTLLARSRPDLTESLYSARIYPFIAQSVSSITGRIPLSIAELFLYLGTAAGIVLLGWATVSIVRTLSTEQKKRKLFRYAATMLAGASIAYFWFVLTCGLNYHRLELTSNTGLVLQDSSPDELYDLCEWLIDEAAKNRLELEEDNNGVMQLTGSARQTARLAEEVFGGLYEALPVLKGNYPPPKPVLLSPLMSYTGIGGIFIPFTFEANVNVDLPDMRIPAVMCHELTHLRGFMREDEANFVAFLACTRSDSREFRYSGYMMALGYSIGQLSETNPDRYAELAARYSEGMLRDLRDESAYWKQFDGTISEISNRINDTYLKANDQSDGSQSYGRMVDLLLAMRREEY